MALWYNARNSAVKMVGGFTAGLRTGWSPIMRLERVIIENYRAIERLELPLHPRLTVLHGNNGDGKTSVLSAIAVGLSAVHRLLPTKVAGIDFQETDRRGMLPLRVELMVVDGITWRRQSSFGRRQSNALRQLEEFVGSITTADKEGRPPLDLPIVAFYDTDRAVFDLPQRRRGFRTEFSRYAALDGALSPRTNFREFFEWFYAKENDELRQQRESRDFNHRIKDLDAVRSAIKAMIPGASQPRTELSPLRFVVSITPEQGEPEILAINQLSGGYRIMLALVADLARRMAEGNPHLDDPLQSEAIVLIDEVDLHLHPSWQQRVLPDLMRAFPKAQFIVSTHSPQVLTTVKPEHIVALYREGDGISAAGAGGHTFGAKAGDVLDVVMGVKERPPGEHNKFVSKLERYNDLVYAGRGESPDALRLRHELEDLSPRDPGLGRADAEMRRQEVMRRIAASNQPEGVR